MSRNLQNLKLVSQRNKKKKRDSLSNEIKTFHRVLKEKLSLQIEAFTKNLLKTFQLQDEEVRSLKNKVKDQSVEIDQLKAKIAKYENRDKKLKLLVLELPEEA